MLLAFQAHPSPARPAPQPTLAPGSHVCGGIGEQGQMDMSVTRSLYNLRLTFAEAGTGAYVTGVAVVIAPVGRGEPYGPFDDCGPLLNVVVSPGAYRVSATYGGVTVTRTLHVGKGATTGTFYWPAQAD
jgi:phage shock protein PspC (stress-responsive transcriptional regulator)